MDVLGCLRDGLRVLILDEDANERLAADRDAFGVGLLFVAGAGLAVGVRALIMRLAWWDLIFGPFLALLMFLGWFFVVHLCAVLLGGTSSYLRLSRPASCAASLGWILLLPVPYLGLVVLAWYLLAAGKTVRVVHRLPPLQASLAILIPLAALFLLLLLWSGLGVWIERLSSGAV